MTLYNPEWRKQGNTYSLLSTDKVGVVQMREMRYNTCWYTYSVNSIQNGAFHSGGAFRDFIGILETFNRFWD